MENAPELKENIGERFKILRKSNKLTQNEFAKKLEVTNAAISMIENGLRFPSSSLIDSACKTFNVSKSWLLNGEKDSSLFKDAVRLLSNPEISERDLEFVVRFLNLPEDERDTLLRFMKY